jgi:hypothetical protein
MTDPLVSVQSLFRNKVNILLVDDDRHILKSLESNFSSPLALLGS